MLALWCCLSAATWRTTIEGAPAAAALTGQVTDAAGPVAGAEIRLLAGDGSGATDAMPVRARTDAAGRFAIDALAAGEWTLDVRHLGHAPHTERVRLRDGDTTTVRVMLRIVPQQLDAVAVESDGVPARYGNLSRMHTFYERRARGRGQFFTREELERRTNQRFGQFLSTTRGARVRPEPDGSYRVTFARCSGPATLDSRSGDLQSIAAGRSAQETPTAMVFLDGQKLSQHDSRQIIGELSLADIEAVEIYSGPSELPLEAIGDACAAIFVWTRFGPGPPARADSSRPPNEPAERPESEDVVPGFRLPLAELFTW